MSKGGGKKRYTSVMEKIIKNAVSESSKVLETVIAELKAELLRVKNENENLKIRCSQFEEVVKRRSVYRETGTSPEPWIIEKCDKAVQCEFTGDKSDDDNPNISDNETQSECSYGPFDEKESSNDSFSFLKTKTTEDNSCDQPDVSDETTQEKSFEMLMDQSCVDPQFDNMEPTNTQETQSSSFEQQNTGTHASLCPHDEQHKESDTSFETSKMEIQEEVCHEYANADESLMECQETCQEKVNEDNLPLEEDVCVSTEMDDIPCNKECESSPLLVLSNAPQQAIEENLEEYVETNLQSSVFSSDMKIADISTLDNTISNNFVLDASTTSASSPPDQQVGISKDIEKSSALVESGPTSTDASSPPDQQVGILKDIEKPSALVESGPTSIDASSHPDQQVGILIDFEKPFGLVESGPTYTNASSHPDQQVDISKDIEKPSALDESGPTSTDACSAPDQQMDISKDIEKPSALVESGPTSTDASSAPDQQMDISKDIKKPSALVEYGPTSSDASRAPDQQVGISIDIEKPSALVESGPTSTNGSSHPDQQLGISKHIEKTSALVESGSTSTDISATAVQSASVNVRTKEAKNTSPSPPKSQYFLRRGRCSSVTLEDAMLLLDAVNQQKYKSSPPKRLQAKDSSKNVTVPKLRKIPESTRSCEEVSRTAESLQPHAASSIKTAEAVDQDIRLSNVDIDHNQSQEIPLPVEAVIDQVLASPTPVKHSISREVTEADSVGLNIEAQHEEIMLASSESLSTENAIPVSTNLNESVETANTSTENDGFEQYDKFTSSTVTQLLAEPPDNVSMPLVTRSKQNRKTSSKQGNILEVEEIISSESSLIDHQHDPNFQVANLPTKESAIQPGEGIGLSALTKKETETDKGETAQVTAHTPAQKVIDIIDLTLSADSPPSEPLDHTVATQQTPIETIGIFDQISGPTPHEGSGVQEGKPPVTASSAPITSPSLNLPAQHTMLLTMTGDTVDQSSSGVKTVATSSGLSPSQLTAVISSVNSAQSGTSAGSSVGTPSGKKSLVAVPFSLQSVIRPHHKIIVIPRQCKVPSTQAVAQDNAVVLKQRTKEATTTFISTTDVNQQKTSSEDSAVNSETQQQATPATSTTQSPEDTSPVMVETSSSGEAKTPCKNTVQIRLNRIAFPVSSAESVSVTDIPVNTPNVVEKKRRGRPPLKKHVAIDSSQTESQEVKPPSPIRAPSPEHSTQEDTLIQSSSGQNDLTTEKIQQPTPEELSPVVAADHSYPQNRMTKSQFLAKLDVSPVVPTARGAYSLERDMQKVSLVERLRSHLKPHILTMKRPQRSDMGQDGSKIPVEKNYPTTASTHETENFPLSDPVFGLRTVTPRAIITKAVITKTASPRTVTPRTVTQKTSPTSKNVSSKAQVKRKPSPKRTVTPPKTVKKRKLKQPDPSNENIVVGRKLSPMQSKIINSNALLSCVRKGIKKKSFLCKFCKKEFGKKKDIETHIQVHVGKKPFQCNICYRKFSRTMELSRHLKRHNLEKKYQCKTCGKSFLEYNNLKRHSYIHSGEKPYTCPHCPKTFTQSGHMKAHIKNRHEDMEEWHKRRQQQHQQQQQQ